MLLSSQDRKVSKSANFESNAFSIKSTAFAFDILSSRLYTDKPLAIIRELAANAYDAHVVAGTQDIPFEVNFPNAFNQTLEIIDYGTGLSHDAVMRLYTTYFESDKNNTNDLIGGMGLGSKTPLAYTDSYTVISRYNGTKTHYTICLSEQGFPTVHKLLSESTDEHNGLSVIIPIKNYDEPKFLNAGCKVLRWYTKVKTNGVDIPKIKYIYTPEAGVIYPDTSYTGFMVLMGRLAYPVDPMMIYDRYYDVVFEHCEMRPYQLRESNLVMQMPIGTLDVTASREGLSYSKRTIEILKTAIPEAVNRASATYLNDLYNQPNVNAAQRRISELLSQGDHPILSNLKDCARIYPSPGRNIMLSIQKNIRVETQHPIIRLNTKGRTKSTLRAAYGINAATLNFETDDKGFPMHTFFSYDTRIESQGRTVNKVKQFITERYNGVDNIPGRNVFYIVDAVDIPNHPTLCDHDIIDGTSLPELPKAPRKPRKKGEAPVYDLLRLTGDGNRTIKIRSDDPQLKFNSFYVRLHRNDVMYEGHKAGVISDLYSLKRQMELLDPRLNGWVIYGIPASKKVELNFPTFSLIDKAIEIAQEQLADQAFMRDLAFIKDWDHSRFEHVEGIEQSFDIPAIQEWMELRSHYKEVLVRGHIVERLFKRLNTMRYMNENLQAKIPRFDLYEALPTINTSLTEYEKQMEVKYAYLICFYLHETATATHFVRGFQHPDAVKDFWEKKHQQIIKTIEDQS